MRLTTKYYEYNSSVYRVDRWNGHGFVVYSPMGINTGMRSPSDCIWFVP